MPKVASVSKKQGFKLTNPTDEVKLLMGELKGGMLKNARLVGKAYSADAKLNRYLASKDDQGLSFFTDKKRREAILEVINSNTGTTSTAAREAALRRALEQDAQEAVNEEIASVSRGLTLTDEQKTLLAAKGAARVKFINEKLIPQMVSIGRHELGIIEDVKVEAQPVEQVEA